MGRVRELRGSGLHTSLSLNSEYFDWLMYEILGHDPEAFQERFISKELHEIAFVYTVNLDSNRMHDALSRRREFCYEKGYGETFEAILNENPISLFEVLVGLCVYMSSQMTDEDVGEFIFYNELLDNSGMLRYGAYPHTDTLEFKKNVYSLAHHIMYRYYNSDGRGGFFPLKHPNGDQRKQEIWYQMQAYLMENYYIDDSI